MLFRKGKILNESYKSVTVSLCCLLKQSGAKPKTQWPLTGSQCENATAERETHALTQIKKGNSAEKRELLEYEEI